MEHLKEVPQRATTSQERNKGKLLLVGIVFILLGSLFVLRECAPSKRPALNLEITK